MRPETPGSVWESSLQGQVSVQASSKSCLEAGPLLLQNVVAASRQSKPGAHAVRHVLCSPWDGVPNRGLVSYSTCLNDACSRGA